jgi:hypothetical protein
LFWGADRPGTRRITPSVEEIAAPSSEKIPGAIAGDAVEPGKEGALATEMPKPPVRLDERFLRRVFCVGWQ